MYGCNRLSVLDAKGSELLVELENVCIFAARKTKDSNYGLKYVRIGIQAPQSPYVTETRPIYYIDPTTKDLNYSNMSGVIYKKANNSEEKNIFVFISPTAEQKCAQRRCT